MEIEFRNKKLLVLYQKGCSRGYSYSRSFVEKFSSRIQVLEASTVVTDLWKSPSLNFEKMQGYANRYSVRINGQYRLEFDIEWADDIKTTGRVIIIEISKHYE